MRRSERISLWMLLGLVGACAGDLATQDVGLAAAAQSGAAGAAADSGRCADGFPRGVASGGAAELVVRMTPSPEGVAVCPGGDVFVARDPSGEIWRVDVDAREQQLWARIGDRRPAGITCDETGRLFVATFATASGKQASLGPVMIAGKDSAPLELPQPTAAKPIAGLNGIVAAPGVGVYASDTNNGNILLFEETSAGVWSAREVAKDVALANGLAYAPRARTLYANASGSWQLLKFEVGADGALSERADVPVPFMWFMDGVAVDEQDELYVADWLGGNVLKVSSGKSVLRVSNPASLAFRGGTLLATDYRLGDAQAEGGLYAQALGVCGAD
jgi:sugar lactone lactonase YvrE